MANTYIERNMTGNTASKKMTFSCWLKKSNPATDGRVFGSQALACHSYWLSTGELRVDFSQKDSGSTDAALKTNRKFTDTNAWYHIVFALDTTLGTADDRIKLWVNGVQETSFAVRTNPSQDATYAYGQSGYYSVGARTSNQGGAGHYFDGLMSHVHYCDGYAYAASDFGLTDATTGEWKINTNPSVTHGTNGFFLKMENSANMDLDSSTNSHSFTTSGTLTATKDNPSNVFATLNPLVRHQGTLDLGNTRFGTTGSWRGIPATIGVSTGKWYWEFKQVVQTNWSQNGIMSSREEGGYNGIYSTYVGNLEGGLALNSGNGDFYHDGSSGAYSTSAWFAGGLSAGDIIGVALDATNSKIWFSKNGTWGNSSNPSTGSGGIDFSGDTDFTSNKPYFPACSLDQCECAYNFGNGYFGTTAVATNSGNGYSDADGKAKFNYEVPTNFKAITTRGLNL